MRIRTRNQALERARSFILSHFKMKRGEILIQADAMLLNGIAARFEKHMPQIDLVDLLCLYAEWVNKAITYGHSPYKVGIHKDDKSYEMNFLLRSHGVLTVVIFRDGSGVIRQVNPNLEIYTINIPCPT